MTRKARTDEEPSVLSSDQPASQSSTALRSYPPTHPPCTMSRRPSATTRASWHRRAGGGLTHHTHTPPHPHMTTEPFAQSATTPAPSPPSPPAVSSHSWPCRLPRLTLLLSTTTCCLLPACPSPCPLSTHAPGPMLQLQSPPPPLLGLQQPRVVQQPARAAASAPEQHHGPTSQPARQREALPTTRTLLRLSTRPRCTAHQALHQSRPPLLHSSHPPKQELPIDA